MSLLASFLDTRATRAAITLAVALHAVVLFGLTHYSRTGHAVMAPHASRDTYQPITVVFVGQVASLLQVAAPTPAPPPVARVPLHTPPGVQAPAQAAPAAQTTEEAAPVAAPVASAGIADTAARETRPPTASNGPQDAGAHGPPIQAAQPDYAYNPQPDYPMLLREQGVGGVVWLRVWVDSEGHPGEIKLAKGSGFRLLDDAALRAVRQWRFVPAKKGAQSLASWVEFPIRFTLNG